ncbi:hypothetical protein SPHINGOT1_470050 [Sphingomonas sp. T1]|nr:hypothetical protein SPHINGOT1_470050 [Sphingomonas sp. T1]
MTSSLRLASAGSRTGPPRPEHGSLAPRQPLRVARLLRLARARAYAEDGPHRLARIAVGHPADHLATPRRCRWPSPLQYGSCGTARSRRDDPFGSPTRYASHAPGDLYRRP